MSLEKRHKQFYAKRQEPAPETPIPVRRKRSEKKPTLRHLQQKLAAEQKSLNIWEDGGPYRRKDSDGQLSDLLQSIVNYHRENIKKLEAMIAKLEAEKGK